MNNELENIGQKFAFISDDDFCEVLIRWKNGQIFTYEDEIEIMYRAGYILFCDLENKILA
jgi:hypothetical protein